MDEAYVGQCKNVTTQLVARYNAIMGEVAKQAVQHLFNKPNSNISVLISTVAFGMGVNIPDIDHVSHWGFTEE